MANFDLVLSSVEVEDDEVQLVGLVCLSLAAKVELIMGQSGCCNDIFHSQ